MIFELNFYSYCFNPSIYGKNKTIKFKEDSYEITKLKERRISCFR